MADGHCGCNDHALHAARRVVLTGGPGAGKTAVLEVLRRQLCEHVVVLPESASIIFGGGFPRRRTVPARKAAQLAIFHVQTQLEALASAEDNPALVLCDRGIVDGLAYWPGPETDYWSTVGCTRAEAFARYAVVIHLRVPPEDGGYDHRNPIRTETAAEALEIDANILGAWEGHPNRYVIDSTADFRTKMASALDIIEQLVPTCCRQHLEVMRISRP